MKRNCLIGQVCDPAKPPGNLRWSRRDCGCSWPQRPRRAARCCAHRLWSTGAHFLSGATAAALFTAAPHAATATTLTLSGLTPSAELTAREFLVDVREARRGLVDVEPLVESGSFKDVRLALRAAPISGIRKACSKIIRQMSEGSPLQKAKTAEYEAIKTSLGTIDEACKPEKEKETVPADLLKEVRAPRRRARRCRAHAGQAAQSQRRMKAAMAMRPPRWTHLTACR